MNRLSITFLNGALAERDESNRKHYCKLLLRLKLNSDLVTMKYIFVFRHLSSKRIHRLCAFGSTAVPPRKVLAVCRQAG